MKRVQNTVFQKQILIHQFFFSLHATRGWHICPTLQKAVENTVLNREIFASILFLQFSQMLCQT
jgi:hypothetical protein